MFNIFDKLYGLNKLNFIGKIDYKYYFEYIQYLNILSYVNFNAKIKYFRDIVGSLHCEKIMIDKKLLNMSNWDLKNGDTIVQNLALISNNLNFKEYQIFTKVFFNELHEIDYKYGILFNNLNVPNFIKYDIINITDIIDNITLGGYHVFLSWVFEYIVLKLNDKVLFNKYILLLIAQEDYLLINHEYLTNNKFITEENINEIMNKMDIQILYKKYRKYSSLKYKYVNAYIDLMVKFKKPLINIKRFMNEFTIKDDYDFMIANSWCVIMPSFKKDYESKINIWLHRCIKFNKKE